MLIAVRANSHMFIHDYPHILGGSNMTGTDFFKTIFTKHLLAHVSLQRTPPPESTQPPCMISLCVTSVFESVPLNVKCIKPLYTLRRGGPRE